MQPCNRLTEGRALCRTVSRIELGLFHPAQKRIGNDANRTSSLFKCPQDHLRIHAPRITPCASRPHKLSRPFLEVSVNRNDFGARRLQFRTRCRHIHGESLRANDEDHAVSFAGGWIFFFNTRRDWSFLHVTQLTSSAEYLSWQHPGRV